MENTKLKLKLAKSTMRTLIAVLDDIRKDLENYQTDTGKKLMDDITWSNLFAERVASSIASYEELYL